jgi:hypothetical protein
MIEAAETVEWRLESAFEVVVGERQLLSTYPFCEIGLVTIDIGCGDVM